MGAKQPDKIQRKPARRSKDFNYNPCAPFDLMEPPEEWQFEKPIASGTITGRKNIEVSMINLAAFVPNKEVKDMRFLDLPMDKQIKIVADEYNVGTKITEIEDKLGISKQVIYNRLDKGKAIGLITEMRGQGNAAEQATMPTPDLPKATVEDFTTRAERKLELAERLAKEAELLQRAGHIALALTELLGDKADPIVSQLYTEVGA